MFEVTASWAAEAAACGLWLVGLLKIWSLTFQVRMSHRHWSHHHHFYMLIHRVKGRHLSLCFLLLIGSWQEGEEPFWECQVRFLTFLGVGHDSHTFAVIVDGGTQRFECHVFWCEPDAGILSEAVQAACMVSNRKLEVTGRNTWDDQPGAALHLTNSWNLNDEVASYHLLFFSFVYPLNTSFNYDLC